MMEKTENSTLSCVEPICDTWGHKDNAGNWDISLQFDYSKKSVQEHNRWYANILKDTLEALSCLTRAYAISFEPICSDKGKYEGVSLIWQPDQSYENYLENAFETIKKYPVDISWIDVDYDFFVYVRTKKSFSKPVRTWVREFGESIELSRMMIDLSLEDKEPGILFSMNHTLFYPFSYNADNDDDNTELFELNQPLLEEALRNWEQKFDAEIEADGLPGIYKYGFLPEDQW